MLTRATVTMVGVSMVGGALATVLSLGEAPERPLRHDDEVTVSLRDGWVEYQSSLAPSPPRAPVSSLAWVNAFRTDVAGPAGDAPVRVDVEAAPSPLQGGATLLRVVVQAGRRAGPTLRDARLRLEFFGSEVSAWRAPERSDWQPAGCALVATLDELRPGVARVLFVEVDLPMRYGGAIGTATLRGVSEGRDVQQTVPLERSRGDLDDATSDFRFFAAVFALAEHARGAATVRSELIDPLLADTTLGVPEREAFLEQGLLRAFGKVRGRLGPVWIDDY